ncbi:MAG: lipopolysaccharide heptosyltransferase II [Pyrinomonadaceae bacterium]
MKGRELKAEKIERVVVRGTNWVGDAVMTIPALRELRRVLPRAHITLVTRSWADGIFGDADFVDDLLICDRGAHSFGALWRQTREWGKRSFNLAVLFQNAFEAALIPTLARVPARFGYATDNRRLLLTHSLELPAWRDARHEVFYYMNIVRELEEQLYGASGILESAPVFALGVSEARKHEASEILRARGAHADRSFVALCPGSTNSRAKRWPVNYYATLADHLMERAGIDVVLVGAPDEASVSQDVAARMHRQPVILTGHTSLAQLVAVLSLADLLVTNDTGPAHIAAALERPTLVIFGPTDPTTTRPYSEAAEIVRRPPACAPCMLRDCPIDHRCMTVITPEEVFKRAAALLHKTRAEVWA